MKITLLNIGVTRENYLKEGIAVFEKRIKHYIPFEMIFLNEPGNKKSFPGQVQKDKEGKIILSALAKADKPVLLDVSGKQTDSEGFARFIAQCMNSRARNLVFITGGPYGFSDEVYSAVTERLSLSQMTFSHQLIRLIFLEQLYRAFTIIRGEPYHHA